MLCMQSCIADCFNFLNARNLDAISPGNVQVLGIHGGVIPQFWIAGYQHFSYDHEWEKNNSSLKNKENISASETQINCLGQRISIVAFCGYQIAITGTSEMWSTGASSKEALQNLVWKKFKTE